MHIIIGLQNTSKLKLMKLKGETDESTLTTRDSNTFFSIIIWGRVFQAEEKV